MKPRTRTPSRRLTSTALWARVAEDHATMLWSAGEVIGRRTAAMAAHGLAPNARERAELRTMVEEKHSAIFEGSLAAWSKMLALQQASWLDAMRLTMQGGLGLVPPLAATTGGRGAGSAATPRWISPFETQWRTQLQIFEAASEPFRERVAANRKRLGS